MTLAVYIGVNYTITQAAERAALSALAAERPVRVLASPVRFNPLKRSLVLEYPGEYRFGEYRFLSSGFTATPPAIRKGDPRLFAAARATLKGRQFLHWARFPYAFSREENGVEKITIVDARYISDADKPTLRWLRDADAGRRTNRERPRLNALPQIG